MPEETVFIGNDAVKLKLAPITVVYSQAYKNTFYPDRVMINPEMTIKHFNQLREISPFAAAFFKIVVPDYPEAITLNSLKEAAPGFQHLVGLFELSLLFTLQRQKFGWKHPETYLHPKYQANLADALIAFSDPKQFAAIIKDVKKALLENKDAGLTEGN